MASLKFKGVEFYDSSNPPTRRFRIDEGGPDDEVWTVRGSDDIISTAPGRIPRNRVKDTLPITVPGFINGVGPDIATQRVVYQQTLALLHTVLQTDGTVGALVWEAPNGTAYTIQARYMGKSRGDWQNGVFRRFVLDFESVDSDGWTVVP